MKLTPAPDRYVVKYLKRGSDGRETSRTRILTAASLFGAVTRAKGLAERDERPVMIAVAGYH